jgi:hypothetical protein
MGQKLINIVIYEIDRIPLVKVKAFCHSLHLDHESSFFLQDTCAAQIFMGIFHYHPNRNRSYLHKFYLRQAEKNSLITKKAKEP